MVVVGGRFIVVMARVVGVVNVVCCVGGVVVVGVVMVVAGRVGTLNSQLT